MSESFGKSVLLVEDEYLIAADLALSLQDLGFHIIGPAASISAALTLLTESTPDAAVFLYLPLATRAGCFR
jgi:YesN/AraC family two-component response regulator